MISRVRGDNSASMDNTISGPSERLANEPDMSLDSLEGGASANDGCLVPTTPSPAQQTAYFNQPTDSANSGDQPALLDLSGQETMEYAENLVRELLNGTDNILVRQKDNSTENVGVPETATETEKEIETGKRENGK